MAIAQQMGRPMQPRAVMTILVVALVIGASALLYGYVSKLAPSAVPYGEFLAGVEAGTVTRVVQIGTTLEVSSPHGDYRVDLPNVLTDVYADVSHAAAAGEVVVPEFSAQPETDTSWIGLVLTALVPLAVVLVVVVLALLVVRPARGQGGRSLTGRLREVDDAHRLGLVTDDEWQRKRARIIDEA
jgi:hypothetical protein